MSNSAPERMDFGSLPVASLLSAYGDLLDELRRREVIRSTNNPLSDYAELLFCRAFGWIREGNSAAGFDAVGADGMRYQIKGRRLSPLNSSRQLSAIRKLEIDPPPFDFLAGLLVDREFKILRGAIVPVAVVRERSTKVGHTNSWRFLLRDEIWQRPGVRDVTADIREAAQTL
jgi:hypothetical protein